LPDSPAEQLGRLAIDRGLITATELREALEELGRRVASGEESELGEVLVDLGALSSEELATLSGGGGAPAQPPSVKKRLGNFELLKSLGTGGMGSVYLARQVSMDRLVALKILKPVLAEDRDFVKRFLREARLAGQLDHPNLVRGIDVGQLGKSYYLAMEYVEGPSLLEVLREKLILPEREALGYALDVARALSCAHKHAIIHRDIKPANVLIDKKGNAKLTDLGLAKQVSGETQLTQTGVTMGSPDYVSPEQAGGEREVDIRGDIYSLGITLFHLVTGQTPFTGPTAISIMTKHLTGRVPWAQDVKPEVSRNTCRVIARMTARSPEDRYQHPAELISDLESLLAGKDPAVALAAARVATAPSMALSPDAKAVTRRPPSPAVPTATPIPEKPSEARKARFKRWGINCLAILGGIFLILLLVGMCAGNKKDPEEKKPPAIVPNVEPRVEPPVNPRVRPPVEPQTVYKGNVAAAVPADALLLAVVAPPERWKKFREDSPLAGIWKQKELRDYFSPMLASARAWLDARKRELEKSTSGALRFEDFQKTVQGEFGVALLGFKPPADKTARRDEFPLLLFLAQTGGKHERFEEALERTSQRLKRAHRDGKLHKPQVREEQVGDVRAFILEIGGKPQAAWSFYKECFLFSFDFEAVKRGLLCLQGKTPALAGAAVPQRGPRHLLSVTANMARFLELKRAANPQDPELRRLQAAGLGEVKRVTYRLELDAGQFREQLRLEIGRAAGLLRILAGSKALTREALRMGPGDSTAFLTARLPADQLLPMLHQFVARTDQIDGTRENEKLKGFQAILTHWGLDLERLLSKGLTGGLAVSVGAPEALLAPPSAVLVAGVRDKGLARDLIQMLGRFALHSKREAEVKERLGSKAIWKGPGAYDERVKALLAAHGSEILAHRTSSTNYQGAELYIMRRAANSMLQLSAALTRNRLVLGASPKAVKTALRVILKKGLPSLDQNQNCLRLWKRLPPGPSALLYLDSPRAMELYGPLLFGALWAGGPAPLRGRRPPDAKLLSPHLAPSAAALYATPGELRLEIIAKVPRGLPLLWMIIEGDLQKTAD
jgi:eukaryotic-like serine/threonine-protein kinase